MEAQTTSQGLNKWRRDQGQDPEARGEERAAEREASRDRGTKQSLCDNDVEKKGKKKK